MFAANKSGRDLLIGIAETIVPTGAPPPKAVYHFADVAELQTQYPNIEVTPPTGDLDVSLSDDIGSVLTYWVIASVSSAKPEETDAYCESYLTALVNAYAFGEGKVDGAPYRFIASRIDTSPPFTTTTNTQVRSVAVEVVVEFRE
jgi:hypothetical protein